MIIPFNIADKNCILNPKLCSLWEMEGIMSNNCGEFLITRFPFSSPCLIRRGLPRTTSLNWLSCFVLAPSNAAGTALGAVPTLLHFPCEFGVGSSGLGERSPDLAFSVLHYLILPRLLPQQCCWSVLSLIARLICSCRAP